MEFEVRVIYLFGSNFIVGDRIVVILEEFIMYFFGLNCMCLYFRMLVKIVIGECIDSFVFLRLYL